MAKVGGLSETLLFGHILACESEGVAMVGIPLEVDPNVCVVEAVKTVWTIKIEGAGCDDSSKDVAVVVYYEAVCKAVENLLAPSKNIATGVLVCNGEVNDVGTVNLVALLASFSVVGICAVATGDTVKIL